MKAGILQVLKWGAIAAAVSAVVNTILFLMFHAIGVIDDSILLEPNKEPMTMVPVIFSSIIPSLVGTVVFYLLYRFAKNGYKIFAIISLVLMLLSFINPYAMIPAVTHGYATALNLMHIVVVISLLYFLKRAIKPAEN